MPHPIPPSLTSYISACLAPDDAHAQTLVTSTLSTPSPWLTLRLIYAAIHGVDQVTPNTTRRPAGDLSHAGGYPVIFLSLLRPYAQWVEIGKKLGLDIPSLIQSRRIVYIDGLGTSGAGTEISPLVGLKSLAIDAVEVALSEALRALSTPSTVPSRGAITTAAARNPVSPSPASTEAKPVVVIDGIDFIIASQPAASPLAMQTVLSTVRARSQALIVACSADGPLLHNHDGPAASTTPLEVNHAHFVASMAHQSRWVFQLRGLDTGAAKDVSGVVRVSRGGVDDASDHGEAGASWKKEDLSDGEWLYQIKGDASVRVWGRGE